MKNFCSNVALIAAAFFAIPAMAAADVPTVCIAMPKAQLGQGNNSTTDVSAPVRQSLTQYLAGPSVQLMQLDARVPIQIEAEAVEKNCNYVLQTSVTQKKKVSAGKFLKAFGPLASALPMLGGMGGSMGGMVAGQVASSVVTASTMASADDMQQDYMAAMTGAQQTNVKDGDTLTVEYQLSATGNMSASKPVALQAEAEEDGQDVIGPLLEQVATAVLTEVIAT